MERFDRHAVVHGVYVEHKAPLQFYVTRLIGDADQAEDVVQETMLRAWKHAEQLTADKGPVWGWLTKVARNIVIDRARARRTRPSEVQDDDGHSDHNPRTWTPDPTTDLVSSIALSDLLDQINPAQRAVLEEIYFADRTASTAAVELGIPLGTVKSRLHQGLQRMRRQIEDGPDRLAA